MFTGLVADLGRVADVSSSGDGVRLTVATALADEIGLGDSVAVNGVCLTAVSVDDGAFTTEVMNETLRLSSLKAVGAGSAVNLELAVRASDRLGGHIMQGHVDGVGTVSAIVADGFARRVTSTRPPTSCATSSTRARSRSTAFPSRLLGWITDPLPFP